MSEGDIQLILHRLDELDARLCQIHDEVRRTNGRVTSLELEKARAEGDRRSRAVHHMVGTSVVSGGLLAVIIWFVTQAI
jgi:hypothetical protein